MLVVIQVKATIRLLLMKTVTAFQNVIPPKNQSLFQEKNLCLDVQIAHWPLVVMNAIQLILKPSTEITYFAPNASMEAQHCQTVDAFSKTVSQSTIWVMELPFVTHVSLGFILFKTPFFVKFVHSQLQTVFRAKLIVKTTPKQSVWSAQRDMLRLMETMNANNVQF